MVLCYLMGVLTSPWILGLCAHKKRIASCQMRKCRRRVTSFVF
ncbi:hypothetical protein AKJ16_DCAP19318 [Drosera capensis]